MTHSRHQTQKAAHPYFLTCTVVSRVPIFTDPEAAQRVLDVWRGLQERGRLAVYGYVILEDFFQLLAAAEDLKKDVDEMKSLVARGVIELLEAKQVRAVLRHLKRDPAQPESQPAPDLWEPGSTPQRMLTRDAMREKLEQIHNVPVQRGYVSDRTLWRYSSARNYAGQPGVLVVATDW